MNILVTGAKGFIGKNLIIELKNRGYDHVFEFDVDSDVMLLEKYAAKADFVYHLAGINRSSNLEDFSTGNSDFTKTLLKSLKDHVNTCPVMLASSIQAKLDNPYGRSKKAAEEAVLEYNRETGARVFIFRLPNVFGKWCRPNYNSVIATFCNNIANDLPIQVNDPSAGLNLVYIDDVVNELINSLEAMETKGDKFIDISTVHRTTLGEVVELIYSFKKSRENKTVPNMADKFTKNLYSTYLSYLPENQFSYDLKMNIDQRGSFTEFLKTPDRGQVSVNISKPGVIKGNHWHHTKNEKFLVVSGKGVIRFRKIDSKAIIEYFVDSEKLQVVDIPIGYTHNIENLGETDMVTIMWANEAFDPQNPDTYYLEV